MKIASTKVFTLEMTEEEMDDLLNWLFIARGKEPDSNLDDMIREINTELEDR